MVAISVSENLLYVLTEKGHVLATGNQIHNRLLDYNADTYGSSTSKPFDLSGRIPLLPQERIAKTYAFLSNGAVITTQGRLLMWGANSEGELGNGTTNSDAKTAGTSDVFANTPLDPGDEIVEVFGGYSSYAAITLYGKVFVWGRNYSYHMMNSTSTRYTSPTEVTAHFNLTSGDTIDTIGFGINSGFAKSKQGLIFTWGRDTSYGTLGRGTTTTSILPYDITTNFNLNQNETITSLQASYEHTFHALQPATHYQLMIQANYVDVLTNTTLSELVYEGVYATCAPYTLQVTTEQMEGDIEVTTTLLDPNHVFLENLDMQTRAVFYYDVYTGEEYDEYYYSGYVYLSVDDEQVSFIVPTSNGWSPHYVIVVSSNLKTGNPIDGLIELYYMEVARNVLQIAMA